MALADNKIVRYFIEARGEMKKVIWPSRKEATNHTVLVISISLGVAAFLGAIDYLLNLGLEKIIK
ncbi:preprotein translocase subunit SecE [Candidatus Uhrbacteria bacterium]|nr:preprotein translocase subunit SecE [Candidatus Uhrbacteria bacterium]